MKNILRVLSVALIILYIVGCNKQKPSVAETSASDTTAVERKSADSLAQLNAILLEALKSKNKTLYMSYCFTSEQEDKVSQILNDDKKKKYFQREFGFSLHEEVAYFENIVKYIEKTGIDLNLIDSSLIESFDYNRSNYSPIPLKEVIIPIIQEGVERDIVYVAIQIDGKWYFTSELSL